MLKIDVYLSKVCSSFDQLRENIDLALAETGVQSQVDYHRVDFDEAVKLGVRGSPSVWINGKDAFEENAVGFS
jgi:hypothetical protein